MDACERDSRRIGASLYAWRNPPFRLWAIVRCHELAQRGEQSALVIWFDNRALDATELEHAGEPEFAVRRADGSVERSPHSPHSPPELRLRKAG